MTMEKDTKTKHAAGNNINLWRVFNDLGVY